MSYTNPLTERPDSFKSVQPINFDTTGKTPGILDLFAPVKQEGKRLWQLSETNFKSESKGDDAGVCSTF